MRVEPQPTRLEVLQDIERQLAALVGDLRVIAEREREVVKLRYVLNGDVDPVSLEEIGRWLGITREHVRQAEALARLAVQRELEALAA
jgi:RNA polymerase primary sigma factor